MEPFAKEINGLRHLTIFTERSILDVWRGSKYASDDYISLLHLEILVLITQVHKQALFREAAELEDM